MARTYGKAQDLIDFTRASSATALRRVKYGAELVTNGTFDTDTSGWTPVNSILSVNSDALRVTYDGASPRAQQAFTTVIGNVYAFSVDAVALGGISGFLIRVGTFAGSSSYYSSGNTFVAGTFSGVFTATDTSAFITVYAIFSGAADDFAEYDNISVKEVTFDTSDGDLVLFNHPNNIPRIEYDANGNLLGLLVEEARTNLFTYSEDFSNAAWVADELIVTPNAAIAPDGTQTADLISDTAVDNRHILYRPLSTSSAHSGSIFIKDAGRRYVGVVFHYPSSTKTSILDLQEGVITDNDGVSVLSIESVGDGWYRVFTTSSASSVFVISLSNVDNNDGALQFGSPQYVGNGSGVYIWGAQAEAGSFPTSYIPTSGSTATRSADVASLSTSAFGYRQDEGSVVVDASSNGVSALIAYLSDSTANERIFLYINDGYQGYITDGGSVQAQIDGGTTQSGYNKIGLGYKTNDTSLSLNGGNAVTDTACSMPLITKMNIGSDFNNAVAATRHIKSIKYYPRRLTNAQLQELTS